MGHKNSRDIFCVWTDLYLSCLLLGLPLFVLPSGYEQIYQNKVAFFLWSSRIYLIGIPVLFAELLLTGQMKVAKIKDYFRHNRTIQSVLVGLYLCFVFLSALFSAYNGVWSGYEEKNGFQTILLYGLLFFAVLSFGQWKRLFAVLLSISCTWNCLIAMLQFCGLNPLWLFPDGVNYYDSGVRYSGSYLGLIGNADYFSAFLTLAIPLLCLMFFHDRTFMRWIFMAVSLIGLATLVLSGVSAGLLAVGVTAFLLFPVVLIINRPQLFVNKRRIFFLSYYVLLPLLCLTAIYFYPGTGGTLYEFSMLLHGELRADFGSGRIAIWQDVFGRIAENPMWGGGPDTYGERSKILFTRMLADGTPIQTRPVNAHNEYLNVLVNTGIFSLISLLGVLCATFFQLLKSRLEKRSLLVFAGALLCYSIQALFSYSSCVTAPIFWAVLAVIIKEMNEKGGGKSYENKQVKHRKALVS